MNAQFALVAHEREMQLVTYSIELVGGWLLAGFRSVPVHLANCESVAGHRVLPLYIRVAAFVEVDLERSVRIQRPDSAKRVGPRAGECCWTGCGSGRARAHEHYHSAYENNSEKVL